MSETPFESANMWRSYPQAALRMTLGRVPDNIADADDIIDDDLDDQND